MTPFASVALFANRNDDVVFKPPRKERPDKLTQARRAAMRYWRGRAGDDSLVAVLVVREFAGRLEISERAADTNSSRPWLEFSREIPEAMQEPHLAACMAELSVGPGRADLPDVLEINGAIYTRDI